ncbi:hypothetical protein [Pseudonocardia endophytica]|uniref:ROS/MUCR transcriptional regulator protein n=1 Tax=Pseudonocardia endophytica TaxID=401976 RepID=A0A4R1I6T1_PSEEN|nr:hypothetical protein [Pseudonocardia endophytica]TCK25802.1 hypothetical protein EV378_1627 [Pseudonocardia endophytica]
MPAPAIHDGPVGELSDGTVHFVPIGEMEIDEEAARCHLCGDWFRSVGVHLRVHGWDRAGYRDAFGLERGQSLESLTTQRRRSTALTRRRARDPRVRAGCETGLRWATSGELTRAAATSARGRRQPEQRRRKTVRALESISVRARAEATTRASVARLRDTADRVARSAGHDSIGDLVRERVGAGASLAELSREAGLHKDWLCRHLATIDPESAEEIRPLVSGPRPVRHDAALRERVGAAGFDDVGDYLRRRHLTEHRTVASIATELGVSRPSVDAAMTRHGVPVTVHAAVRRRTEERAAAVATDFGYACLADYLHARRSVGLSWRRIAHECGQPATWLRRRSGLPD